MPGATPGAIAVRRWEPQYPGQTSSGVTSYGALGHVPPLVTPLQTSNPLQNFSQIRSAFLEEVCLTQTDKQTNRQTDRQTNSELNIAMHYHSRGNKEPPPEISRLVDVIIAITTIFWTVFEAVMRHYSTEQFADRVGFSWRRVRPTIV